MHRPESRVVSSRKARLHNIVQDRSGYHPQRRTRIKPYKHHFLGAWKYNIPTSHGLSWDVSYEKMAIFEGRPIIFHTQSNRGNKNCSAWSPGTCGYRFSEFFDCMVRKNDTFILGCYLHVGGEYNIIWSAINGQWFYIFWIRARNFKKNESQKIHQVVGFKIGKIKYQQNSQILNLTTMVVVLCEQNSQLEEHEWRPQPRNT